MELVAEDITQSVIAAYVEEEAAVTTDDQDITMITGYDNTTKVHQKRNSSIHKLYGGGDVLKSPDRNKEEKFATTFSVKKQREEEIENANGEMLLNVAAGGGVGGATERQQDSSAVYKRITRQILRESRKKSPPQLKV